MTATNPWNAARFKTVRITDAYMTATNPWNAARFKTVRIGVLSFSFYQHTGASVYTYDTSIWNMTWIHTGMGTTSRVVKAISAVIIIFWIYVIIIIITTKHF